MNYKEKFEDFLDKMQGLLDNAKKQGHIIIRVEDLENTLTELKDGDEDERIREDLIEYFRWNVQQLLNDFSNKEVVAWLEKQGKLVNSLSKGLDNAHERIDELIQKNNELCIKLEKQGEPNPYSGISLDYNGHTWGMCARDNGVDILLDKQLFKHLEKQDKQKVPVVDFKAEDWYVSKVDGKIYNAKFMESSEKQGEQVEINPSEFDLRLNRLLKQFESLPKEELTNSLSFYLNVVQNDGTYVEEKQGEQKPANKVEPKFKVGDWVIRNNEYTGIPVQVIEFKGYYRCNLNGEVVTLTPNDVHNNFHLWTIQDAKDGDVLFMDNGSANCIFIYKSFNNGIINKYGSYNNFGFEGEHYLVLNDGYAIPATKEQRDTLFAKMKEAGYEWNADKKELKKIEQKPTNENPTDVGHEYYSELLNNDDSDTIDEYAYQCAYCISHDWMKETATWEDVQKAVKLGAEWQKQNPAECSEEDEDAIEMAIIALEDMYDEDAPNTTYGGYNLPFNKAAERLKSIKDRVQPKPMQEWKQENIEELTEFENAMMHIGGSFFGENAGLDPNDTDTIKEQAELLLELAPKQEWSEEDEEYINDLIGVFDGQQHQAHSDEEVVNWLKSIRLQYNKEWGKRDEEMLKSIIATCELACEDRDSSPARHLLEMQTNWLKSLKQEIGWKPSEEQIMCLQDALSDYHRRGYKAETFETLLKQLKQL